MSGINPAPALLSWFDNADHDDHQRDMKAACIGLSQLAWRCGLDRSVRALTLVEHFLSWIDAAHLWTLVGTRKFLRA